MTASTVPSAVEDRSRMDGWFGSDPMELVLRCTLVMMLMFPRGYWWHVFLVQAAAATGLVAPRLRQRPWFWLIVAVEHLGLGNLQIWAIADNHEWLFTYWYLAIGMALLASKPREVLKENARLLVGLTFLFAVLRKALAAEYMSGAAFRFLLATDSRFFELSKLFANHSQNPGVIFDRMAGLAPEVSFSPSDSLNQLALFMTCWTLAIEIAIAALFLLPLSPRMQRVRCATMLVFVVTTYPIAPVIGFAWVLLIMGMTQIGKREPRILLAYVVMLLTTFAWKAEKLKMAIFELAFGKEFFELTG